MRNIIYLLFLFSIVFLPSCQEDAEMNEINNIACTEGDIVLQERSPLLPQEIKSEGIKKSSRSTTDIKQCNSEDYLGFSYFAGNTFLGNPKNTGMEVLDLDVIKAKSPKRIVSKMINQSSYNYYLYDDTMSYSRIIRDSKTFTFGFSINIFNLIKLGRKKTHTEFFKDSVVSSSRVVYGEVDIRNMNKSYALSTTSSDLKFYARECLSPLFLDNLYGNSISKTLNDYGETVMTGYITGGRMFALTSGLHKESSQLTIKAKDMGTDLNASFFFDNDSVNGSVTIGNGAGTAVKKSEKIEKSQISMTCIGGDISLQPLPATMDLEKLSLDLTPWWRSLSNVNNHNIIDITDNGLVPLSAFLLEKNFQRRIDDTVNGYLPVYSKLQIPYIEIVRVLIGSNSGTLYEVAPVLNTRNGDKIVLSDGAYKTQTESELRANADNSVYDTKVMEILPKIREYFPLIRIVKNYNTKYNLSVRVPLCLRMDGFDPEGFVRHQTDNGMVYLYNKTAKIAFSYYEDTEDIVMNTYGIEEWIYSIEDEDRPLSMSTLANLYTVIGL